MLPCAPAEVRHRLAQGAAGSGHQGPDSDQELLPEQQDAPEAGHGAPGTWGQAAQEQPAQQTLQLASCWQPSGPRASGCSAWGAAVAGAAAAGQVSHRHTILATTAAGTDPQQAAHPPVKQRHQRSAGAPLSMAARHASRLPLAAQAFATPLGCFPVIGKGEASPSERSDSAQVTKGVVANRLHTSLPSNDSLSPCPGTHGAGVSGAATAGQVGCRHSARHWQRSGCLLLGGCTPFCRTPLIDTVPALRAGQPLLPRAQPHQRLRHLTACIPLPTSQPSASSRQGQGDWRRAGRAAMAPRQAPWHERQAQRPQLQLASRSLSGTQLDTV